MKCRNRTVHANYDTSCCSIYMKCRIATLHANDVNFHISSSTKCRTLHEVFHCGTRQRVCIALHQIIVDHWWPLLIFLFFNCTPFVTGVIYNNQPNVNSCPHHHHHHQSIFRLEMYILTWNLFIYIHLYIYLFCGGFLFIKLFYIFCFNIFGSQNYFWLQKYF